MATFLDLEEGQGPFEGIPEQEIFQNSGKTDIQKPGMETDKGVVGEEAVSATLHAMQAKYKFPLNNTGEHRQDKLAA